MQSFSCFTCRPGGCKTICKPIHDRVSGARTGFLATAAEWTLSSVDCVDDTNRVRVKFGLVIGAQIKDLGLSQASFGLVLGVILGITLGLIYRIVFALIEVGPAAWFYLWTPSWGPTSTRLSDKNKTSK